MDIKSTISNQAVTSVLFWDGPEEYVTPFDFTVPDTTPYCNCCDDPVPTAVSFIIIYWGFWGGGFFQLFYFK